MKIRRNEEENRIRKAVVGKAGLAAVVTVMIAMGMTGCGMGEAALDPGFDSASADYTSEDYDTGSDYDYTCDFDGAEDADYTADSSAGSSASSQTYKSNTEYNTEYNNEYNWYEDCSDEDDDFDVEDCDWDEEEWDEEDDEYEYDEDDEAIEDAGSEPDSDADYASDALVRVGEVEFTAEHPVIGGTEAVISTEVTNRKGGTVTMIGCTLYDDMGYALISKNESCNITDSTFDITYNTYDDMGYLLEDRIYHYCFVVEIDGKMYSHNGEIFTTNHADDKFFFQTQPVKQTKEQATLSIRITNPTMARVATVCCRVYTPQGLELAFEEKTVDTTSSDFTVDFEINNGDEELPSSEEFGYEFYIKYGGKEYYSYSEEFTTLP